jgi:predicted DNA binding CopG/RHH family protein
MKKRLKKIPQFENEDEERDFWANHSSVDYFDWSKAVRISFPNLRFSTETISLRMPQDLLNDIKILANKKDVPYQSLIKIMLDRALREEKGQVQYSHEYHPYGLLFDKPKKQGYTAKKKKE